MKAVFALVLLAAVALSDTAVIKDTTKASRANLIVGNVIAGDRVLHSAYVYQPARPNTVQYQDVIYRGQANTRISFVRALEVGYTQFASAHIIAGGIGRNNVTVRFTSARGYGYYYLLEIWGR